MSTYKVVNDAGTPVANGCQNMDIAIQKATEYIAKYPSRACYIDEVTRLASVKSKSSPVEVTYL